MQKYIILLILCIIPSLANDCTDCANGYKIITDLYYCKGIFGQPDCQSNKDCEKDFTDYQLCAYTGCFGDLSNLSSISDYNNCFKDCKANTDPVKAFAKGMYNCMDVAESNRLIFSIALYTLLISAFLLF